MTAPEPRPALRKAPDAHLHPAAPGHALHTLLPPTAPSPRPPADDQPAAAAAPDEQSVPGPSTEPAQPQDSTPDGEPARHRLSGPLRGTTSDGLRAATRRARPAKAGKTAEKTVDLGVKVPKTLRKEFRAAARADKRDPDVIVTALLKSWLGT